MYSEITFTNANAASASLLLPTRTAKAKGLSWKYEMAGDEFGKQQDSGQHPSAAVVRRLLITFNGQIVGDGNNAAGFTAYWANRATLMAALLPDDGPPAAYQHGRLTVTPIGGAQMYADVVMVDNDFPTDQQDYTTSLYTVTWRCDRGYWLATAGDTVVKL